MQLFSQEDRKKSSEKGRKETVKLGKHCRRDDARKEDEEEEKDAEKQQRR